MFFILSRLLSVFLSPLIWIIILLFLSLVFKKKLRRSLFTLAMALLLIFSNGAIFHFVASLWETPQKSVTSLDASCRTVVVLGGMASENRSNGLPRFMQSSDRLWQALWLLQTGVADTMVISGGRGTLFDKQRSEGLLLVDYLEDIKVMDERILVEAKSRNTYENAVKTSELFTRRGMSKKIILVTSAFHMPRAARCFKSQGFQVETYPADPLSGVRPLQWNDYVIPSAGTLESWGVLFREWVGFVMYRINGYFKEQNQHDQNGLAQKEHV